MIALAGLIISIISLVTTSWIAWKYTNYKNRRSIVIDKINSNLLIINSTICKFNRWALFNKSNNVILYEIATIEKQFPKLYNFLISLGNYGSVLNKIDENTPLSYLNLKLLLKFFIMFQDKLSYLIYFFSKKSNKNEYIENNFLDCQEIISKLKNETYEPQNVIFYLLNVDSEIEKKFIKLFSFNVYFVKENKIHNKFFGFRFIKEHNIEIKNKKEFYLKIYRKEAKESKEMSASINI